VLSSLCDVEKSKTRYRNADKGIGILAGSQLRQYGIGIPVSGTVQICPALFSFVYYHVISFDQLQGINAETT
jgi:hypothetical protein